jgi:cytochrome c oxidase subunit 2
MPSLLIPGHPNYVQIEASHPGNYAGECAVYCGEQHAHMRLLVVAQSAEDFQAWEAGQRKPASPPTSPEAVAGEQIFLGGPCSMCHQVRGAVAGGRVAPDLTHIASRQLIASDTFPNNTAATPPARITSSPGKCGIGWDSIMSPWGPAQATTTT